MKCAKMFIGLVLLAVSTSVLLAEVDPFARKWIEMLKDGVEGEYKGMDGVLRTPRITGVLKNTSGAGAKVSAISGSYSVEEYGDGVSHRTVFTFDSVPVTNIVYGGSGTNSLGSVKVYDFPEGRILIEGVTVNDVIVTAQDAVTNTGFSATDGGDWSFGTAVGSAADLTGTAVDIAPKTSADPIVSTNDAALSVSAQFDGTTTAKDMYFNILVDADDITNGTATCIFSGSATVTWKNLGDY